MCRYTNSVEVLLCHSLVASSISLGDDGDDDDHWIDDGWDVAGIYQTYSFEEMNVIWARTFLDSKSPAT